MGTVGTGRLSGSLLLAVLATAACLSFGVSEATAGQKLETIDVPSALVDPAVQDFAGPVSSTMGPHPGTLKANVLLPDGYTNKKRYPLLLLLHGAGERYDSWSDAELGDIRNTAKGLNAVVVMPEGAHSFYANWFNDGTDIGGAGNGWEDYFRDGLLPRIHKRFSIRPERRYHAVAGFSMGGYGTYLTGSLLNSYFGTVVPLSAFASIRTPETQLAFSVASGGVPFETIYGPPSGSYAEGHDPLEWGPNFRYSNMDVYTGDGLPDPALRPENSTPTDSISLLLESFLKRQNDSTVQAIRDAGNTTTDYTVHPGSHHFEFWRPDLRSAINKGLFRPVEEQPSSWEYVTSSHSGQAWDIHFQFSSAPSQVTTFTREGKVLSATGDGDLTIVDGNGCSFQATIPFTRKLSGKPCRKLKLKTSGKPKAGKKRVIKVKVNGAGAPGPVAAVDYAKVKIGDKTAFTDSSGKASIKVKVKKTKKLKPLKVVVKKSGFSPVRKKLAVRR
ncbi:MAG: alpha/beta hydrolase-fold protein [Solirubrobacterales bacterium]